MITENIYSTQSKHSFIGESFEHSLVEGAFLFNQMKKICGIYKITSKSGKIYIGQTVNWYKRLSYYKNGSCREQPLIYRSLKKYGIDNHKFEIIHECSPDQLNDLEIYYIELYQSFNNLNGLNLKAGGQNGGNLSVESIEKMKKSLVGRVSPNKGKKLSEEHKRKLSIAHSGKTLTKAHVDKIQKSRKGYKHSDETKNKISKANKDKIRTNETILKLRESHKGHKHSEETKKKMSISHNKNK